MKKSEIKKMIKEEMKNLNEMGTTDMEGRMTLTKKGCAGDWENICQMTDAPIKAKIINIRFEKVKYQ